MPQGGRDTIHRLVLAHAVKSAVCAVIYLTYMLTLRELASATVPAAGLYHELSPSCTCADMGS